MSVEKVNIGVEKLREVIQFIEKKKRNLEKRKNKLECYKNQETPLNEDQKLAVSKCSEVDANIVFSSDIIGFVESCVKDCERAVKRAQKNERMERKRQENKLLEATFSSYLALERVSTNDIVKDALLRSSVLSLDECVVLQSYGHLLRQSASSSSVSVSSTGIDSSGECSNALNARKDIKMILDRLMPINDQPDSKKCFENVTLLDGSENKSLLSSVTFADLAGIINKLTALHWLMSPNYAAQAKALLIDGADDENEDDESEFVDATDGLDTGSQGQFVTVSQALPLLVTTSMVEAEPTLSISQYGSSGDPMAHFEEHTASVSSPTTLEMSRSPADYIRAGEMMSSDSKTVLALQSQVPVSETPLISLTSTQTQLDEVPDFMMPLQTKFNFMNSSYLTAAMGVTTISPPSHSEESVLYPTASGVQPASTNVRASPGNAMCGHPTATNEKMAFDAACRTSRAEATIEELDVSSGVAKENTLGDENAPDRNARNIQAWNMESDSIDQWRAEDMQKAKMRRQEEDVFSTATKSDFLNSTATHGGGMTTGALRGGVGANRGYNRGGMRGNFTTGGPNRGGYARGGGHNTTGYMRGGGRGIGSSGGGNVPRGSPYLGGNGGNTRGRLSGPAGAMRRTELQQGV